MFKIVFKLLFFLFYFFNFFFFLFFIFLWKYSCQFFSISKTKVVVARIRTFLRWIYNAAMQWKKFIIFFNFIYYIFIILIIKIKVLILASFVLWKKWIKIEPNIENYWICDIEKDSPFWKTKNNLCFYELNSTHLQLKN